MNPALNCLTNSEIEELSKLGVETLTHPDISLKGVIEQRSNWLIEPASDRQKARLKFLGYRYSTEFLLKPSARVLLDDLITRKNTEEWERLKRERNSSEIRDIPYAWELEACFGSPDPLEVEEPTPSQRRNLETLGLRRRPHNQQHLEWMLNEEQSRLAAEDTAPSQAEFAQLLGDAFDDSLADEYLVSRLLRPIKKALTGILDTNLDYWPPKYLRSVQIAIANWDGCRGLPCYGPRLSWDELETSSDKLSEEQKMAVFLLVSEALPSEFFVSLKPRTAKLRPLKEALGRKYENSGLVQLARHALEKLAMEAGKPQHATPRPGSDLKVSYRWFGGGYLFGCGKRAFLLEGHHPYELTEICSDGRMPFVGEFKTQVQAELAVKAATAEKIQFPGDTFATRPLELKIDGSGGLYSITCRRRSFTVVQFERGRPWDITESGPWGQTIGIGSFPTLQSAKERLLHLCTSRPAWARVNVEEVRLSDPVRSSGPPVSKVPPQIPSPESSDNRSAELRVSNPGKSVAVATDTDEKMPGLPFYSSGLPLTTLPKWIPSTKPSLDPNRRLRAPDPGQTMNTVSDNTAPLAPRSAAQGAVQKPAKSVTENDFLLQPQKGQRGKALLIVLPLVAFAVIAYFCWQALAWLYSSGTLLLLGIGALIGVAVWLAFQWDKSSKQKRLKRRSTRRDVVPGDRRDAGLLIRTRWPKLRSNHSFYD